MSKHLITLIIIAAIFGCSGGGGSSDQESVFKLTGDWSYLKSGIYLANGDVDAAYNIETQRYPSIGYIDEVFGDYNTNTNLEYCRYTRGEFTIQEIIDWMGFARVVIVYSTDQMHYKTYDDTKFYSTWVLEPCQIEGLDIQEVHIAFFTK